MLTDSWDSLKISLRNARSVTILTGAGVSAESGLPTFRDAISGIWSQFRPEDLATPEAFLKSPKLVWDWYLSRRKAAKEAQPNPAHIAIARLQELIPQFTLITQNVDGLHQRAGSTNVVELHGNIHRTICFDEKIIVEMNDETIEEPPHCPHCGGLLRPDVVWFGEYLPVEAEHIAKRATRNCDVFISIGTSGVVQPAASLLRIAMEFGANGVVINPDISDFSSNAIRIPEKAGECLPKLISEVWP